MAGCCLLAVVTAIAVWRLGPSGGPRESSSPNEHRLLSDDLPREGEAPDWPFLRGPAFDGHADDTPLAEAWPESGPPVLWSRRLGQGYSGIVAAGRRVWTQYQSLSGQFVVCLDADTGETLWEHRYDWPYEAAGVYPGPRATPTLANGRVFFASPRGLIGCLSDSGKLRWTVELLQTLHGRGAGFGYACSPVVVENKVLLPVGGENAAMVALDADTGRILWQSGNDEASYTPALPIVVDGQRQVIGYLQNVLASFDLETGRLLWRVELSQGYDEHSAWPIFVEPHLWISAPFRAGSQMLRLSGAPDAPAEPLWRSSVMSNDVCSSVYHAGNLYGFDLKDQQAKTHRPSRGHFRCLEFTTGRELWSTDRTGQSTLLLADDKLLLFSDTGELILARASPERYDELARTTVFGGETCWTPPALHRGRGYVRSHSQIACLYLGRPEDLDESRRVHARTVADIPRTAAQFPWEALLGVEPDYAFDVPSPQWLWNWFVTGLLLLAGSAAVVAILGVKARRHGASRTEPRAWRAFWCIAFVLGGVAITPLSLWRGEFVFTWPVCLFVAFQATVQQVSWRAAGTPGGTQEATGWARWKSRLVALGFLGVCLVYYLLCRRLCLVFEWAFLFGFGAAIPFVLAQRFLPHRARWRRGAEFLLTAAAFAAYYWSCVAFLYWRYPGAG
ncbi:MAG: PQQ-binding-like beta-propeller repeat protein [Planctomycetales bacterium]